MLGDILLSKLSYLPLNKLPPKAEIDDMYNGIENFGVNTQHLRVCVNKYCKDVKKYLKMEELLNKQLSLDGQARCVANTELLLSEAFGKKASLKAILHTELAQLVQ